MPNLCKWKSKTWQSLSNFDNTHTHVCKPLYTPQLCKRKSKTRQSLSDFDNNQCTI